MVPPEAVYLYQGEPPPPLIDLFSTVTLLYWLPLMPNTNEGGSHICIS